MNEDCLYKDVCNMLCVSSCLRYRMMNTLLDMSNIPKSQQTIHRLQPEDIDMRAFEQLADIQSDIKTFVNNGGMLYIYSKNCGNGKTTWTIKLMLQYFDEIWAYSGFEPKGIFINVPTFLIKSKDIISNPDEKFIQMRDRLSNVDLVVFDDISASKLSAYDYNTLMGYIDTRLFNQKSTIFTGNVPPENLSSIVGERLASRICNGTKIEFKGRDMRK